MSDQLSLLPDASPQEVAAAIVAERDGATHRHDPPTSLAAAAGVKTGTQRHKALKALGVFYEPGLTGHQVATALNHPLPHVYTTRLEELEAVRCVERTDETRPTWSGHQAIVWRITDFGREMLAELAGDDRLRNGDR